MEVDLLRDPLGQRAPREPPSEPWGPYIQRFSFAGEDLLFFTQSMNGWLNERQRLATAPAVVDCAGLAYVPP